MSLPLTHARELIQRLLKEAEMSPTEIAEALDHRVSSRTIYRWANGETYPQNWSDFEALQKLMTNKFGQAQEDV